jgi:hypothetical protein
VTALHQMQQLTTEAGHQISKQALRHAAKWCIAMIRDALQCMNTSPVSLFTSSLPCSSLLAAPTCLTHCRLLCACPHCSVAGAGDAAASGDGGHQLNNQRSCGAVDVLSADRPRSRRVCLHNMTGCGDSILMWQPAQQACWAAVVFVAALVGTYQSLLHARQTSSDACSHHYLKHSHSRQVRWFNLGLSCGLSKYDST